MNRRSIRAQRLGVAAFLTLPLMLSACVTQTNSADDFSNSTANVEPTISDEDYTRYATSSDEGYKIVCFAWAEGEVLIAQVKLKEANQLAQQEGKLPVAGVEQALDVVVAKGYANQPDAVALVNGFCDRVSG